MSSGIVGSSGGVSSGNHGAIELTLKKPHFGDLEMSKVKKSSKSDLDDPNFLLDGTIFVVLVVFSIGLGPVVYLGLLAGLNELDKAATAEARGGIKPRRSGGAPALALFEQKKKKKIE